MQFIVEGLKNEKVYIFGAGTRGQYLCPILERYSIYVEAFIDNNFDKCGKSVCGKKIFDLDTLLGEEGLEINIIVSPLNNTEIIKQLADLSCKNVYDGSEILEEIFYLPIKVFEDDFKNVCPFNHYESPYPDIKEIHEKEQKIFDINKDILDIDFNLKLQFEYIERMKKMEIIDWKSEKDQYRYHYNNGWFDKGSADVLYYMMRFIEPRKIIEVGSGFSTAVMLDTNNKYFENSIEINAIEPNAKRLKSLLREEDNIKIYEKNLQDIPLIFFEELKENDILFIDSSHVSKINSDVNYYLYEIFPRLSEGVFIHIHDIFYPFVYPPKWVYEGRAYNELYMIRAFLMNNSKYSIQFWGDMIAQKFPDKLNSKLANISGSLWLRKE